MLGRILLAPFLFFAVLSASSLAQGECAPPAIVANDKAFILFTPEQEMILGDLLIEQISTEFRFVRDEKLSAYLNRIGERIAKGLPPTGLRYRFYLIDMPEVNAFNIPGGHVFISRKLVAFSNNEDELAGVVAHELGHAVVRHAAVDLSNDLKKVLNVTSLGDRKDVLEKYNLLIERYRTKRITRKRDHMDEKQLEADRIGVYAMAAAGYDASAFTSAYDRLAETEGKTGGGWFSSIFGTPRPEQKRLREIVRANEKLPPACREGRSARATEDFLKWQADVVSFRETGRKEELPGLLWKKELSPKLRSDVTHLSFSEDGKLLLAQDDFGINVIEREPLRALFQIPVEGAYEASFTSDGKHVVFLTKNLRYEKWSVEERKPLEMRELAVKRDCWESRLSPDGQHLACVDVSRDVFLLETKTGKKVWTKKDFYPLNIFEYFAWLNSADPDEDGKPNFFRIEFSPDSRYVMFSRTTKHRFRYTVDHLEMMSSENTAVAVDLTAMKTVEIGGDLKKISARPYVFLGPDRIVGNPSKKSEEGGIFSFPAGKRLQKFLMAAKTIKRTASPDHIVIKPLMNAQMGIFDMKRGVVASGLKKSDATMWNDVIAYEGSSGKLFLREAKYNEEKKTFDFKEAAPLELPVGSVSGLVAADVSNNFDWLLFSSKTRGGLWQVSTGERKFHVRGFKGAVVADDGGGVCDFPPFDETERALALLNPHQNTVEAVRSLPEKGARQFRRFVLLRSSLKQPKEKEKNKKKDEEKAYFSEEEDETDLQREVRFELKDFIRDKVIWSRDFAKDAPEYSFDEFSGRLIFFWRLGGDEGKARLKELPEMKAKADSLGNKADDYLVEIFDAFAQRFVGALLIETGKGSFDLSRGFSEGEWLLLHDSEGRALIYSIKDGDIRHRFFARQAAINPKRNQIVVQNYPGEVSLYDLSTGERAANFVINGSAAFVRFNLEGDRLLVLGDTQTVYAFDLNKLAAANNSQTR